MIPFCISMALNTESEIYLRKLYENFTIKIDSYDCFYHTTLLQGVTDSLEKLIYYIENSDNILRKSKTIRNINKWDLYSKGPLSIKQDFYNKEYSVIMLNYSNSLILNIISLSLIKDLKENGYICNLPISTFTKHKGASKDKFNYSINHYKKIFSFEYCAHTTLGFYKLNKNLSSEIKNKFINIPYNKITHEGIYISTLNDFCMTPYKNRKLLINLK